MPLKIVKSFLITIAVILMAIVLFIWISGWNWARSPIEYVVHEKTGRQLQIKGDLTVAYAWPSPVVSAKNVSFSNPQWANQAKMLTVEKIDLKLDLLSLLKLKVEFPQVALTKPIVNLELAGDGKKSWLLDIAQSDDNARIPVGNLVLDTGVLTYLDTKQNTDLRTELSSTGDTRHLLNLDVNNIALKSDHQAGLTFKLTGLIKGETIKADGIGGGVLTLQNQNTAYPLKFDATIGHTTIVGDGTITNLIKLSAVDMQLAVKGDNLANLFHFINLTFPNSHTYSIAGRIIHSNQSWRFEKFAGVIGKSDISGTFAFDLAGKKPMLQGNLSSKLLDLNDLAPLIGAKNSASAKVKTVNNTTTNNQKVLPNIPFKTENWNTLNADVKLTAQSIVRDKALALDNLNVHLMMQDSLLTLNPLDFGFAGGHLTSVIMLNGLKNPMQANVKMSVRQINLAKLLPTVDLTQNSVGHINGNFDLNGQGNSVDRMLASANGRVSLVVDKGKVSQLLIEKIGLHIDDILKLKIAGDNIIKLNCAVADFDVKRGLMQTNALVLDTEVSTVIGNGQINLNQETLNLTLNPKTKNTSFVALSTPIYVTGSFANPAIDVNKGKIAARGLGAIALSILNPLLILVPLLDVGPGVDNECTKLIKQTQARKS